MEYELENRSANVASALEDLSYLTRRLNYLARLAAVLTLMSLVGSVIFVAGPRLFLTRFGFEIAGASLVCFSLGSVFYTFLFESRKKMGDVLFKEISDELQWYVRFASNETSSSPSSSSEVRPDLSARITLRLFARSADLPLVPGPYGPAIYAVINILCVVFATVWGLYR